MFVESPEIQLSLKVASSNFLVGLVNQTYSTILDPEASLLPTSPLTCSYPMSYPEHHQGFSYGLRIFSCLQWIACSLSIDLESIGLLVNSPLSAGVSTLQVSSTQTASGKKNWFRIYIESKLSIGIYVDIYKQVHQTFRRGLFF